MIQGLLCEDKIYDLEPLNPIRYYEGIVEGRVLDVGCGTGNLGKFLMGQKNECFGITISEQEAELARKKLTGVTVGDIEAMDTLPFSEHFFDTVIFADSLEHLRNPKHALSLVKPYLKSDGTVIASIPNVANFVIRMNLFRGRFEYQKTGILDETHLRFYTFKSAQELIRSVGYSIIDIKFQNWNLGFPGFITRLFSFCEWEIRERMTRWWPGLFATQFVIYAKKNGERIF